MSGGSSSNSSWTILTPEESVAETLRPLAEGTEHHEESHTSAADPGENQPAHGAPAAEGLPVQGHLISEETSAEPSEDSSTDQHASLPTAVTNAPVPSSLEVSGSLTPGNDALSQSEGLPEGPEQSSPDPDSFSDSYSHIAPSPDEPPATLLTPETLREVELTDEEEKLTQEETLHRLNGEGLQQEEEESDLFQGTTDIGKQAVYLVDQLVMELFSIWARKLSGEAVVDSPVDSEVSQETTEKTGDEGEPEVRRRRSLLAALERIGRREEEEEGDEDFQLPHREEESGFSLNKCILGAVILVGLGTIFLSGVFMDLDEESDYGTSELKDAELPVKQEWLNPDVPPPPVSADSTELLNKLAKGNQQISVLQAQLQAQKEELKVAKGQAAEGAKERLQWEEVEKENSRLKKEMASLPVLQKENERMKRELESVPTLQKELETLRATVTELKLSSAASETAEAPVKPTASPPSGHPGDITQDTAKSTEREERKPWDKPKEKKKDLKKDKNDMAKSEWKEKEKEWKGEKNERKDGGKMEWKKGKHDQKFEKEKDKQRSHSDETKQMKDKDWKKEKASRGDEGNQWKDRGGKQEGKEKNDRKEWKEEKDWKKAKHEKVDEGKQRKGKDEKKEWKVGKEHHHKYKGREEWKKAKDGSKESGKEKREKNDWKEKGEKKEWKKDSDWKSRNDKDHREGKWKGERKQGQESKNHGKERKVKDERKQWSEKSDKYDKEWKRKDEAKQLNENEWKNKNGKYDKEWKRKDETKQLNENEWKNKNGKYDKEWKQKDERKQGEKKEDQWKRGGEKEIKDWNKEKSHKNKDERKYAGDHDHKKEHLWGDRKPPHTHQRLSLDQPEYWVHQRERLQHTAKPPQHCDSLETCAQAEGLLPVTFPEFAAFLQTYLVKTEEVGVDASIREELQKLAAGFFKDGVFIHDQMSFQDFAEDLGDVLEDMVEGDEEDEEEDEDSAIEQEMETFETEVMKKFSVTGAGEKKERSKGEWRKESGRGRG